MTQLLSHLVKQKSMYKLKPLDNSHKPLIKRVINKIHQQYYLWPIRLKLQKKIVDTLPSVPADETLPFSVHTLICQRDLRMGICAAKSLNLVCENALPWVFHDDGTLTPSNCSLLRHHFPGSRIITYQESLTYARKQFGTPSDSKIAEYREKKVLMLKLLDIGHWAKDSRILFIDTDVLFFSKPSAFLQSAFDVNSTNCFNKDHETAYIFDPVDIKKICGVEVKEKINSGLFSVNKNIFNFELVEKWLNQLPLELPFNIHRMEQTLFAMLASASSSGVHHLPEEYNVSYHKPVENAICKHYVGRIRHGFELEGLRYLINELNFINRWNEFVNSRS